MITDKSDWTDEDFLYVMERLYLLVGPELHKHETMCEGCEYEWSEALKIIRNFVPLERRFPSDKNQPYLDPGINL